MLKRGKRALPVNSISRNTALSCLRQLSRSGNLTKLCDVEGAGKNDRLPLDQFIALARPEFRLRPAILDWHTLSKAAKQQQVFLILQNGNMISVIDTGRPGRQELVVSDPLYEEGKAFFLPKNELDHVWRGNALIVSAQLANWPGAFHW